MADAKLLDKIVPVEFEYVTFAEGGPKLVEETRHLYYTMGSLMAMYRQMGVDEEEIRRLKESAEKEDAELSKEQVMAVLGANATVESDLDAAAVILWAGLRYESRQKGEDLTPEDVADMIDLDDIEPMMEKVNEAFSKFEYGAALMAGDEEEGDEKTVDEVPEPEGN